MPGREHRGDSSRRQGHARTPAGDGHGAPDRISKRNAQFQTWQALLTNRNKRQRLGEFLIHGVRPISLAVEHGWPLRRLLHPADARPSSWARRLIEESGVPTTAVDPELMQELGERTDAPELIAVGALPPDDLDRLLGRHGAGPDFLGVAFDRPSSPGNIGTVIRSADAFGASGLVVTGHAADVYDPKAVRASTGSLFRLPVVRSPSPGDVASWVEARRRDGLPITIIGTDERGATSIADCDLSGPTLLVIGNETTGMSARWAELCDATVRIPIGGAASSLNAASAGTLMLYEAARRRGFPAAD